MCLLQTFVCQQTVINEHQSATIDKQFAFIEELSVTMEKQSITIDKQSITIKKQSTLIQQLQEKTEVSVWYIEMISFNTPGQCKYYSYNLSCLADHHIP